jgi:tRNA(adenine34) deaminase
MSRATDEALMRECLRQAALAGEAGEVPVGALVVSDGRTIARGHNLPIATNDPSAHAEIVVLRAAGAALGNYRLSDAELYVTVEPCIMCVGAVIQARLRRVVFGCPDPKAGALGGVVDVRQIAALNHRFEVAGGVCAVDCRSLLQRFFRARRSR